MSPWLVGAEPSFSALGIARLLPSSYSSPSFVEFNATDMQPLTQQILKGTQHWFLGIFFLNISFVFGTLPQTGHSVQSPQTPVYISWDPGNSGFWMPPSKNRFQGEKKDVVGFVSITSVCTVHFACCYISEQVYFLDFFPIFIVHRGG